MLGVSFKHLFVAINSDTIFILVVVLLLLISIKILHILNNKETNMKKENRAKIDMLELEKITENIERDYKPINIELTSYEQEQENNAIISYEELLSNKNTSGICYDENYQSDVEIPVKKIDLTSNIVASSVPTSEIDIQLFNYEKEEAFLKALRQLQNDLAR